MKFIRDIIAEKRRNGVREPATRPGREDMYDEGVIDEVLSESVTHKYADHAGRKAVDFGFPALSREVPDEAPGEMDGWSLLDEEDEEDIPVDERDGVDNLVFYDEDAEDKAPEDEPVEAFGAPRLAPEPAEPARPVRTPTTRPVLQEPPAIEDAPMDEIEVPSPAAGRSAARSGRVKTRILGFSAPQGAGTDPFAAEGAGGAAAYTNFPSGWLIVVDGPGRGAAFTIFEGVAQIGRGETQMVRLDFGDTSISRENHAAVAYDGEQKAFFLGHGGKANLVRLNGRPVLSTEELQSGDKIRIGETTLRFVALCGPDFSWMDGEACHAAAE